MSNLKAVKLFNENMRSKGFKSMSFLIHTDDAEIVRNLVQKLKQKRLSNLIISPEDTVKSLKKLNLSDQQFQRIHHKPKETSERHSFYLTGIKRYQENNKNYDVAKRIKCIKKFKEETYSTDEAITECLKLTPLL